MKNMIIIISAFFAIALSAAAAAVIILKDSDTDSRLLTAADVEKIEQVISREYNKDNNVLSVNLIGGYDGQTYLRFNYTDRSACFYLNGRSCKVQDDNKILVGVTEIDDFSDAASQLCGLYNGYLIQRENAERELGEKLSDFYYGNFYTENDNYEGIAIDFSGGMFLMEDDCIKPISGVKFDFYDEVDIDE